MTTQAKIREMLASVEGRKPLELLAAVELLDIEAADDGDDKKLRGFSMVAYTGAAMRFWAWPHPVVVDVRGMRVTKKARPILRDHNPGKVVGHTESIRKADGQLEVAGVISGAGPDAQEIIESSGNGFPWQASIGARIRKMDLVAEGKTVKVNGREFEGPVYVARQTTLGEVSFVALGADDDTSAKVAATAAGKLESMDMEFEKWVESRGFVFAELDENQAASLKAMYDAEQAQAESKKTSKVEATADELADPAEQLREQMRVEAAAESQRIADVRQVCAGRHADIEAKAIKEGWDASKTELTVLRAERPAAPAAHVSAGNRVAGSTLEAAVCLAGGLANVEKHFSEQVLDAADEQFKRQLGLQELLLTAATANGYRGRFRGNERQVLEAAFGTLDLPGILSAVANKFLLAGFDAVESAWRAIAAIRNVSDFKTHTSYRLTGDFEYEEVGADGELKHATVGEEAYTNAADTYGKMFSVTRKDIINDDLGALTAVPLRLGRGAALKFNDVFWSVFLDNATFFTAALGNYADGAATALGVDGLTEAELLFFDQTDPDGKPLAVNPSVLLVPNALNVKANVLMRSTEVRDASGTEPEGTANPHAGKFAVVRSAYLSNAKYSGASALAYYLLADPMDMPVIEAAFLNGQQTPTVESADADFSVLGIQMRGYHDFGVSKQEPRGGVKMKGEA